MGATAVVLMGTTQAGDKNNVALKSRVLPHNALIAVGFFLEVPEFHKLPVVWYMTIGKVMRCKYLF